MLSLLLYVSSFPMHSFCHIFPFTTTKELLQIIKTTSLAGGLSTAYKAAVTSLSLKGPLIKI
jgi:hypothetical protein